MKFITILGHNIRKNLHLEPGEPLAPVIGLYENGQMRYGLSAVIHGDSQTIYAARPEESEVCGAEVYIRTDAPVSLHQTATLPPKGRSSNFIHTNTHHAKSNRASLKRDKGTATLAFKPVVSVRAGKSAKAQMCMEVQASGTSYLIYAAPGSDITPMPCGARVWQQVTGNVTLVTASSDTATTQDDMDDMDEKAELLKEEAPPS